MVAELSKVLELVQVVLHICENLPQDYCVNPCYYDGFSSTCLPCVDPCSGTSAQAWQDCSKHCLIGNGTTNIFNLTSLHLSTHQEDQVSTTQLHPHTEVSTYKPIGTNMKPSRIQRLRNTFPEESPIFKWLVVLEFLIIVCLLFVMAYVASTKATNQAVRQEVVTLKDLKALDERDEQVSSSPTTSGVRNAIREENSSTEINVRNASQEDNSSDEQPYMQQMPEEPLAYDEEHNQIAVHPESGGSQHQSPTFSAQVSDYSSMRSLMSTRTSHSDPLITQSGSSTNSEGAGDIMTSRKTPLTSPTDDIAQAATGNLAVPSTSANPRFFNADSYATHVHRTGNRPIATVPPTNRSSHISISSREFESSQSTAGQPSSSTINDSD